jgi:hypothetical protein
MHVSFPAMYCHLWNLLQPSISFLLTETRQRVVAVATAVAAAVHRWCHHDRRRTVMRLDNSSSLNDTSTRGAGARAGRSTSSRGSSTDTTTATTTASSNHLRASKVEIIKCLGRGRGNCDSVGHEERSGDEGGDSLLHVVLSRHAKRDRRNLGSWLVDETRNKRAAKQQKRGGDSLHHDDSNVDTKEMIEKVESS